jgi:hypothetical protein
VPCILGFQSKDLYINTFLDLGQQKLVWPFCLPKCICKLYCIDLELWEGILRNFFPHFLFLVNQHPFFPQVSYVSGAHYTCKKPLLLLNMNLQSFCWENRKVECLEIMCQYCYASTFFENRSCNLCYNTLNNKLEFCAEHSQSKWEPVS